MSDALKKVSLQSTPQMEPTPGRTDEVVNNAGGYVFEVDRWDRLNRFLILGTDGGTYYANQNDLTKQNVDVLVDLVAEDSRRFVDTVVAVSDQGRAPKNDQALFALAIASSHGTDQERGYALEMLPRVARTSTHLFDFLTYVQNMRGWGRALRRAVSNWYLGRETDSVAYQVIKYRQRNGWTHRDVLRKAHPEPTNTEMAEIFDWVTHEASVTHPLIEAYEQAKEADADTAVQLISEYGLPWEALPTEVLNEPKVWEAMLPKMGLTALMRNLPRLTNLGLLTPFSDTGKLVASRLTDKDELTKSRIHPISVLVALTTYSSGQSTRGASTWQPVSVITDALNSAFYASFGNVVPSGKNTLIGLDVSGSMSWSSIQSLNGITPRTASAALSLITKATEQNVMTMGFQHNFVPLDISPNQRLDDVAKLTDNLSFGRTDCALPMLWAADNAPEVDTFVVYTDNETWSGQVKPHQALVRYRQKTGRDARLVVCAMTSTGFTIADPNDRGMLDVVGMDTKTPQLISDFSRGEV